jgi:hypothetical protein
MFTEQQPCFYPNSTEGNLKQRFDCYWQHTHRINSPCINDGFLKRDRISVTNPFGPFTKCTVPSSPDINETYDEYNGEGEGDDQSVHQPSVVLVRRKCHISRLTVLVFIRECPDFYIVSSATFQRPVAIMNLLIRITTRVLSDLKVSDTSSGPSERIVGRNHLIETLKKILID